MRPPPTLTEPLCGRSPAMSELTLPGNTTADSPAVNGKPAVNCGDCGVVISAKTRKAHANCFRQYRNPEWIAADPNRCAMPLLSGERCPEPIKGRDWCNKHLQRWNKHGDPTDTSGRREKGELLALVQQAAKGDTDECILAPCERSRPSLMYRGKPMGAARAVWWEANGSDPGDKHLRFTCGRGDDGCINIRHLELDVPDADAVCDVCGDPPTPDNRLKGGKHINYCYQWARRNNASNPQCITPGCDRPSKGGEIKVCDRCYQRIQRGNDPAERPFHQQNKGKQCKVSWCEEDAEVLGWCRDCYGWWWRNGGDPNDRRYRYNRSVDDIMAIVMGITPDPATGCRDSTGIFPQDPCGYPVTSVEGKSGVRVTRLVLSLKLGRPLKRATHACHTCDYPPCVEPSHLWEGTPAANSHDRDAKGRGARGEGNGRSRLNKGAVRFIRDTCMLGTHQFDSNVAELAHMFGVKPQAIRDVVHRRTWRDVP